MVCPIRIKLLAALSHIDPQMPDCAACGEGGVILRVGKVLLVSGRPADGYQHRPGWFLRFLRRQCFQDVPACKSRYFFNAEAVHKISVAAVVLMQKNDIADRQ